MQEKGGKKIKYEMDKEKENIEGMKIRKKSCTAEFQLNFSTSLDRIR
jgi:hypothetical protein